MPTILKNLHVLAFTHKHLELKDIAHLYRETSDELVAFLHTFKQDNTIQEIVYLATCNRVEIYYTSEIEIPVTAFLTYWGIPTQNHSEYITNTLHLHKEAAAKYIMEVASSLNSLVIGEREIITQIRAAFEFAQIQQLSGSILNIIGRKTIEAAKDIFTHTHIADKPVSVVSLAYRKLKSYKLKKDTKFLIIGAGETILSMLKYLKKHGYKNFSIYNRTLENAQKAATLVGGNAFLLEDLKKHTTSFDVLISCTGASNYIVTTEIYKQLLQKDTSKKIILDLALPGDIAPSIPLDFPCTYIEIGSLKTLALENLQERHKEIEHCDQIIKTALLQLKKELKQRQVELAMKEVPNQVKAMTQKAITEVFAKDLEKLSATDQQTVHKLVAYLEKKYISLPMKMAKDIILEL